jgi:hypothetical protein
LEREGGFAGELVLGGIKPNSLVPGYEKKIINRKARKNRKMGKVLIIRIAQPFLSGLSVLCGLIFSLALWHPLSQGQAVIRLTKNGCFKRVY